MASFFEIIEIGQNAREVIKTSEVLSDVSNREAVFYYEKGARTIRKAQY
jgi:hypothetical protein